MAAGIATLQQLYEPGVWSRADVAAQRLLDGIIHVARATRVPIYPTRVGTMLCLYFTDRPVTDWTTAARSDTKRFAIFFHAMLDRGVYLPPSQFEAWFVSTEHGDVEIQNTIIAIEQSFQLLH
jgi:glutamate-1-semialdehyde 2,1-aminomutase